MYLNCTKEKVMSIETRKTESVRICKEVIAKVKANKDASGVNIGRFFEIAAIEKLEAAPTLHRQKSKK